MKLLRSRTRPSPHLTCSVSRAGCTGLGFVLMEDSLVNRTSRESAEALLAAAPERTLHLRGLRDACRSGQDTQSQIWSSEGDATWTLLQTAFSVWDDDDLSEEDTAVIRKLLLAGLQLLNNVVAGNPTTSAALWSAFHPIRFLDLLEWSGRDRGLVTCVCASLHTCLACLPDGTTAIRDLVSCTALFCKLLRVTIPPAAQGGGSSPSDDPVYEWVFFITSRVLQAKQGRQALIKAGLHGGEREAAGMSVVTPEQLILLNLLQHVMEDGQQPVGAGEEGASPVLLLCDGGDLCVELSERLCAWVEGPLSGGVDEQQPDVSAVKMAEAAAGVAVKLLASVLAYEERVAEGEQLRGRLMGAGLVRALVGLLRRAGGRADGVIPPMREPPDVLREGQKADAVRALGNLCHRCRSAQDAVREVEGLGVLLSHCNVDSSNPFLREWALLAVRNVCEGNEENQRSIEALKPQETVTSATLREMGLEAYLKTSGEEASGEAKVSVGVRRTGPTGQGGGVGEEKQGGST